MPHAVISEAFSFVRDLDHLHTREDIEEAVALFVKRRGFDRFKMMEIQHGSGENVRLVMSIGDWPQGWLTRYERKGYLMHDPAALRLATEGLPTVRSTVMAQTNLSDIARQIAVEEQSFGIEDFLSVPIVESGRVPATFCVSGPTYAVSGWDGVIVALAVPTIYRQLKAASQAKAPRPDTGLLSARELECLEWAAKGKTSWEIGEILRVSEHTVTSHLKSAAMKLHATSRAHAVAMALRQQLLT
jgi:LuxR family quorum sensing-dependent transcriptional regulator